MWRKAPFASRFVAAANDTDYNIYCGNTSDHRYYGLIPDCAGHITEWFCIEGHTDLGLPD